MIDASPCLWRGGDECLVGEMIRIDRVMCWLESRFVGMEGTISLLLRRGNKEEDDEGGYCGGNAMVICF